MEKPKTFITGVATAEEVKKTPEPKKFKPRVIAVVDCVKMHTKNECVVVDTEKKSVSTVSSSNQAQITFDSLVNSYAKVFETATDLA
jgi:hypothetical protein